jgi:phage replication-related protein YjqB (UPF0714/DUF867 family)
VFSRRKIDLKKAVFTRNLALNIRKGLMNGQYGSFAELSVAEREGYSYRLRVRNRGTQWVVVAPHGGGIEPGTTEIATAIAGRWCSLYTFDGIRSSGNEVLHITSTLFDEPRCLEIVRASAGVLAIHGCNDLEQVAHVGGLDIGLGDRFIVSLQSAGFHAIRATARFSATQPENICNRGMSGRGVQLEISVGLRRSMFKGLDRINRRVKLPLFQLFVNAIRCAMQTQGTERSGLWCPLKGIF